MTGQTIRVNGHEYNIVIYQTAYGWRAEAGLNGRVIEVIDTPTERAAWDGIRAVLERRTNGRDQKGGETET